MAENFEAAVEICPEGVESKELLVQCSSVVLLDCSCGLPMYRAAIVIEPTIADDFAIRSVIQRSRVYYPSTEFQQGTGEGTDGSLSPGKTSEGQGPGKPSGSGRSSLKPPKVRHACTLTRRDVWSLLVMFLLSHSPKCCQFELSAALSSIMSADTRVS